MSCKVKHESALLNSRDFLITQGAIDKQSNIKSPTKFVEANTQMSEDALNAYGVEGTLWLEKSGRAVPNHSVLKSIDDKRKELGLYDKREAGTFGGVRVKPGVQDVFKSYPTLSQIGSEKNYSLYLDSIFPNSQLKDIVYHGTPHGRESILEQGFLPKKSHIQKSQRAGHWFFKTKINAQMYQMDSLDSSVSSSSGVIYTLLDIRNPLIKDYSYSNNFFAITTDVEDNVDSNYDSVIGYNVEEDVGNDTEYIVYNPEQTFVLGSNQDIQMFKEWMSRSIPEEYIDEPLDSEVIGYEDGSYSAKDFDAQRELIKEGNKDAELLSLETFDENFPELSYATDFEKQMIIDSIKEGDISINCKI